MGCTISAEIGRKTEKAADQSSWANHPLGFTPGQKRIVRRTWTYLCKDFAKMGTTVFSRIFQLRPDLKALFPFNDLEGEDLLNCPAFKGHSSRFMQAVGAVVDNMDDLDAALAPLLLDLGRSHVNFKGFEPEYWNVFSDAMTQVWKERLRHKYTPEVHDAWQSVFRFIQFSLQEGYAKQRGTNITKPDEKTSTTALVSVTQDA